jgi:hypothetical protein
VLNILCNLWNAVLKVKNRMVVWVCLGTMEKSNHDKLKTRYREGAQVTKQKRWKNSESLRLARQALPVEE